MIPDAYYKTIYDINYDNLSKRGYKYIFLDVDNTLIPYKENNASKELIQLINRLKKDFEVFIFSNGHSDRVLKLQEELGIGGYYMCMKPLKKNYIKVIKKYDKDKCIFVGDQFMTDVLGARRNNMKVILVDPIDKSYEPITTKFWRVLEKNKIKKLNKKGLFNIFNYYDKL